MFCMAKKSPGIVQIAAKKLYGYYVVRPIQRWNVENRAERHLEKEEPKAKLAPRHPGTEAAFKQLVRSKEKEIKEDLYTKKEDLLQRLKEVKVKSQDPVAKHPKPVPGIATHYNPDIHGKDKQTMEMKMPWDRNAPQYPDIGYVEPPEHKARPGHIALSKFLNLLTAHHMDPIKNHSDKLAEESNLNKEQLRNVFKHFKPFRAFMPDEYNTPDYEVGDFYVHKNINRFAVTQEQIEEYREKHEANMKQREQTIAEREKKKADARDPLARIDDGLERSDRPISQVDTPLNVSQYDAGYATAKTITGKPAVVDSGGKKK